MGAQGIAVQIAPPSEGRAPRWGRATRIAFRFCFVYFGLYMLLNQILTSLVPLPTVNIPDLSTFPPVRPILLWAATHILRIAHPVSYADTGSGDRTFDWVLLFCELVFAALATLVWSLADRRREHYASMYKWFRLVVRLSLAGQMFGYGMAKAIPAQMPYPSLARLLEPFGNLSPMGVLWASIGASPAYETFAGCAELLAGVLLVIPRTSTLGALVCLADMTQVFTLNMTYDVPVKLLSLHLWLMSLFLLAPELKRLRDFFLANRTAAPSTQIPVFRTQRANRIALAVQLAIGLWLLGANMYSAFYFRHQGAPKSPLYGIWNVAQMSIDGQVRSPLITDYGRLRRVIFDLPAYMSVQRMDESFTTYAGAIDQQKHSLSMKGLRDKNLSASLSFDRPAPGKLVLDGTLDGHKVVMNLEEFDPNKFLLVNRGFHWVQETPFNR